MHRQWTPALLAALVGPNSMLHVQVRCRLDEASLTCIGEQVQHAVDAAIHARPCSNREAAT